MSLQVLQMKPQFGLYKDIDGSRSLQEFCMKRYKHLSKLKISKRPIKTLHNQKLLISTKLSTSIKNLKHLDLSQCNLTNYCLSQLQLIAQRFHRTTRLSHLEEKGWKNGPLLARIMLKKSKNLRHLRLGMLFYHFPQRAIRLSKLKILHLSPIDNLKFDPTPLLNFSKYCPLTIEELSISWKRTVNAEVKDDLSLSRFHNLQNLSLGMVLPANLFKRMIESLAHPSKLKSLRFHISRYYEEHCEPAIRAFLSQCSNLEELSIKTEMNIYPENNSDMKLKKLTLEPTVEYSEEALRLRNFIQQQKDSLETLNLNIQIWGIDPQSGILKSLKSLKRLKKLRLKLSSNIPGINLQSSLTELVEQLDCLEEVDFRPVPGEFNESDFEDFCKALSERNLKSLKLFLRNLKMTPKNSSNFLQALMSFSQLERLTLVSFGVEDPNFYNELREMVCYGNKNLNEVTLENVKREKTKECCDNLIKMLKGIIQKPTMKKLRYIEAPGHNLTSDFKGLQVLNLQNDLLKEVHYFNYLQIPSATCDPPLYDWNLDLYKWSENMDE